VRVALVHDFPDLAGPGDVEIAPGAFAEPWNTFACSHDHLGKRILRAPEAVMATVREKMQAPRGPVPGEAQGVDEAFQAFLEAFSRLEVDVAAFFALRTLDDLMTALEAPSRTRVLRPFRGDPKAFHTVFGRWLRLDPDAPPTLETLITAPWVDEFLPLAAAPAGEAFPVKILRVREGAFVLEAGNAELTVFEPTPHGFVVSGRIPQKFSPGAKIYALWNLSGVEVAPGEASFNPATGFFRFMFSNIRKKNPPRQSLRLLVTDS